MGDLFLMQVFIPRLGAYCHTYWHVLWTEPIMCRNFLMGKCLFHFILISVFYGSFVQVILAATQAHVVVDERHFLRYFWCKITICYETFPLHWDCNECLVENLISNLSIASKTDISWTNTLPYMEMEGYIFKTLRDFLNFMIPIKSSWTYIATTLHIALKKYLSKLQHHS